MEYYLNVNKGNALRNRIVTTNHPFLIGDIIYKVLDDKIIFKKPTIDYTGKTVCFIKCSSGKNYQSGIYADLELKKYYFEEQDNEDELILFLK